MFFATKRATDAISQISAGQQLRYERVLSIPGYTDVGAGNPLVFIQASDYVWANSGVKADVLLMRSNNPVFVETYGAHYFIAGQKFARMKNKLQLATLQAEAVRSGFDVNIRFGMDARAAAELTHVYGATENQRRDYANAAAAEAVAGIFGAHTAMQVVKRMAHNEMAAASRNTVLVNGTRKELQKAGSIPKYTAGAPARTARKGNKRAAKEVRNGSAQPVINGASIEAMMANMTQAAINMATAAMSQAANVAGTAAHVVGAAVDAARPDPVDLEEDPIVTGGAPEPAPEGGAPEPTPVVVIPPAPDGGPAPAPAPAG